MRQGETRITARHGKAGTRIDFEPQISAGYGRDEPTKEMNTLEAVVAHAESLQGIRRKDLQCGDRVLVTTRNSLYTVWVLGEGEYWVWGGWFDQKGLSPHRVGINGCTWGGSIIHRDIVAAPGLQLEFGNRLVTTRIRAVQVIRAEAKYSPN